MSQDFIAEATDALFRAVLPALGVAAAAFTFLCRLAPGRLAGLAAALALTAAFVQGNYLRDAARYRLEDDRPLTAGDLRTAFLDALQRTPPEEGQPATAPPAEYWLPWLAALALLTDALLRWPRVVAWLGWLVRAAVALLAARLLLPEELPQTLKVAQHWAEAALAALVLALWAVPWFLARRQTGGWVAFALSFALQTASMVVLVESSWIRLADVALIGSAALVGVGLSAWAAREATDATAGAAAVLLPGVLLIGQQQAPQAGPVSAFLLAGLSPLALAPLLLVPRRYWPSPWLAVVGVTLVAVVSTAASLLAGAHAMAD